MKFKKTSFWSLLSNATIEKITIPIIQRAYTQGGRSGDPKIEIKGENFLKCLVEALKGNPVLLDFVYGSEKTNKISPLDGQQRLTTLFLLHWYIAQKENKLDDNIKTIFKKFSYETRQSSRYFCEHLCDYIIPETRKEKLSDTVRNEKWYMPYSWNADPTICSMFGMLDKIDVALKYDTNSYWTILTTEVEKCPITFFYTSLQELNLTDDLYIKMNARGLELTDFEKLKAAFNQKIDDEKWDSSKKLTERFKHRIDNIWTNLFWTYRDDNGFIDNKLMNFITGTAINNYAIKYTSAKKDEIEKRIAELTNDSTKITIERFDKDGYDYLVSCLNIYANNSNDTIKSNVNLWNYREKTLFEDFITDKSNYKRRIEYYTYPMRVLFFAQTEYLQNNTFEQTKFDEWMRVVRNIVTNSTIDSATTFISAINLVIELSEGSNDIYDFLSKTAIKSGHAKKQVKQEIKKANIIVINPIANKNVIFDTEDTNFCKGDIDFVLDCVGTFDVAKLTTLKDIIKNDLDVDKKVTDDFKRAFLTIKNNDYYNCWGTWSWSFNCNKKWLLDKNSDLVGFAKGNDWKREYLKDLLVQRMSKTFIDIAKDYFIPVTMPKWKEKLIKGTDKLDNATFILIPKDNSYCNLAWQQRPSREDQVKKINNN